MRPRYLNDAGRQALVTFVRAHPDNPVQPNGKFFHDLAEVLDQSEFKNADCPTITAKVAEGQINRLARSHRCKPFRLLNEVMRKVDPKSATQLANEEEKAGRMEQQSNSRLPNPLASSSGALAVYDQDNGATRNEAALQHRISQDGSNECFCQSLSELERGIIRESRRVEQQWDGRQLPNEFDCAQEVNKISDFLRQGIGSLVHSFSIHHLTFQNLCEDAQLLSQMIIVPSVDTDLNFTERLIFWYNHCNLDAAEFLRSISAAAICQWVFREYDDTCDYTSQVAFAYAYASFWRPSSCTEYIEARSAFSKQKTLSNDEDFQIPADLIESYVDRVGTVCMQFRRSSGADQERDGEEARIQFADFRHKMRQAFEHAIQLRISLARSLVRYEYDFYQVGSRFDQLYMKRSDECSVSSANSTTLRACVALGIRGPDHTGEPKYALLKATVI